MCLDYERWKKISDSCVIVQTKMTFIQDLPEQAWNPMSCVTTSIQSWLFDNCISGNESKYVWTLQKGISLRRRDFNKKCMVVCFHCINAKLPKSMFPSLRHSRGETLNACSVIRNVFTYTNRIN